MSPDFLARRGASSGRSERRESWIEPFPVDIADHGDEFVVAAALPGLDSGDIRVGVQREWIHIEADFDGLDDAGRLVHAEGARGVCSRAIWLPDAVEAPGARAAYRDGVLFVTLQKRRPTDR